MTYNDISAFSISEINSIYNEVKIDMFMTESDLFLDIMKQRSSGILNESVIQESFAEKAKYIWEGIKNFFKSIREAIKKFFNTIIDAITRSFYNQKVDSKSEKIIEVEDKKDDKAVSNNIDQTSKAFDNMTNNRDRVFGSIRANHDRLKSDIDQIKSKQSSNKSSNDASFDKISSDLDKLLTSGEKLENKKSNEPNFTMKDGVGPMPPKEFAGAQFRKAYEISAKKEMPLMIEKKGNRFDYMKKKFGYAVNWVTKEYKGEEKKFGKIQNVAYLNSKMVIVYGEASRKIKERLRWLDSLDYKYAMQQELEDINNVDGPDNELKSATSERIRARYEKKFQRTKDYIDDYKDEIQSEGFYNSMIFGDHYENKTFDETFNEFFDLDKLVDVTNKNLTGSISDQILLNIFDKNKYIKNIKIMYNESIKLINEYENRGKNIKGIIESGVEFYNYIGKDTIDIYLKMVSNITKYIMKYNSKAQTIIKQNRIKSYEIFNNVINFYNQNHK